MRAKYSALSIIGILFWVGFIYYKTMTPGLLFNDGARLQLVVTIGGMAHSPGYPLYIIFAHLFASVLWLEPAFEINLFSLFTSLVVLFVLFRLLLKQNINVFAASVALLSLAFSAGYWALSTRTEVYIFYVLFLVLGLYFAFAYFSDSRPLHFMLACLFWGAFVGGRMIMIPSAILFFLIVIQQQRKRGSLNVKMFITGISLFITPLIINLLYLMITDKFDIGYDYIDAYNKEFDTLANDNNWMHVFHRVMWMVSGAEYEGLFNLNTKNILDGLLVYTRNLFKLNFTILGIMIAFMGFVFYPRKRMTMLLGFIFINNFGYFLYTNAGDRMTFILPSYIIIAFYIAYGIHVLPSKLTRKTVYTTPVALIPLILLVVNYPIVDRSQLYEYETFARQFLQRAPRNAVVFVPSGHGILLIYEQMIHQKRPDLEIIPIIKKYNIKKYLDNNPTDAAVYLYVEEGKFRNSDLTRMELQLISGDSPF